MTRHLLDTRTGAEGSHRRVEAFARVARQSGAAGPDPRAAMIARARTAPAGGAMSRLKAFLARDRRQEP